MVVLEGLVAPVVVEEDGFNREHVVGPEEVDGVGADLDVDLWAREVMPGEEAKETRSRSLRERSVGRLSLYLRNSAWRFARRTRYGSSVSLRSSIVLRGEVTGIRSRRVTSSSFPKEGDLGSTIPARWALPEVLGEVTCTGPPSGLKNPPDPMLLPSEPPQANVDFVNQRLTKSIGPRIRPLSA